MGVFCSTVGPFERERERHKIKKFCFFGVKKVCLESVENVSFPTFPTRSAVQRIGCPRATEVNALNPTSSSLRSLTCCTLTSTEVPKSADGTLEGVVLFPTNTSL